MAGELSFFELGVGDTEQARHFYGALFGWSFAGQGGFGRFAFVKDDQGSSFGLHEPPAGG
jgi:predicted enzyme related to lactoylglutathione lyase